MLFRSGKTRSEARENACLFRSEHAAAVGMCERGDPQGRALAPGGWATVIGNNLALHLPAGSLELAPVGVGGVLIYREKEEKKGLRADGALSSFLMISELSAPRRSHFYSVTFFC